MADGRDTEQNLAAVKARIAEASVAAGRQPDDVTLVAVSKTFGADAIRPALAAGHRVFGENRVQEAEDKWPALRAEFAGVELHLIGLLQSNKTRAALATFDVVQSVDRERIARRIAEAADGLGRAPKVFVQVNTGEEAQKAGVAPDELDALVAACRDTYGLEVAGLMCIPPLDDEAALHFALLAKLAERVGVRGLSMGMSADFETAIAFGATHVRVGSAIFGARPSITPQPADG